MTVSNKPSLALQSLHRLTFNSIQELYAAITPCIEANPTAFPANWKAHHVFQLMQSRKWVQVDTSTKTRFTVILRGRSAPRDLSELNNLDVIPPNDPTY
jgi:hypothetical protein